GRERLARRAPRPQADRRDRGPRAAGALAEAAHRSRPSLRGRNAVPADRRSSRLHGRHRLLAPGARADATGENSPPHQELIMACLRLDLHRLFPQYLDEAASPRTVARLERHLLDCGDCRARLLRMRDAKRFLGELPALDAPSFDRLMSRPPARAPRIPLRVPRFLTHFAADALVATLLFAGFALLYTHTASARSSRPFDLSSFRAV